MNIGLKQLAKSGTMFKKLLDIYKPKEEETLEFKHCTLKIIPKNGDINDKD